jgi:serine/threonine protein phosphatase PrpC
VLNGNFLGEPGMDLYGIFDGHGGTTMAVTGSRQLPDMLRAKIQPADSSLNRAMGEIFPALNADLLKRIETGVLPATSRTCGATALAILLSADTLYVANLGDTRAILSHNGNPIRLSGTTPPPTTNHPPPRLN